jgi:hypothetical protein
MKRIKLGVLSNLAILFVLAGFGQCADAPAPRQETPCEGHARAGCPQVVSPYALPSNTSAYRGYYVGGGAAVHGQPRCPNEGTWGWDYAGLLPRIIALDWWHGAHAQGGGGTYATDHK